MPSDPSGRSLIIPGFHSMKQLLEYLYFSLDGMLVHRRVTPSSKFASSHLYTWMKRGTVRVKCLAHEHNAVTWPGLKPRLCNPESSTLTIRPPPLPLGYFSTLYTVQKLGGLRFYILFTLVGMLLAGPGKKSICWLKLHWCSCQKRTYENSATWWNSGIWRGWNSGETGF